MSDNRHNRHNRHTHRASIVCYGWRSPDIADSLAPREYQIDGRLSQEQAAGFVEDYDTGRGLIVWFTCPAGARARELRNWVSARVPQDWIKGRP